jgi:hypothetical protein
MSGIIGKNTSRSSGIIGTVAAASSDLSGDSSPQLGGFLDANGNYIQMEKGGDIASASPTVIDTDGDFFAVTGTSNFSAFSVAADRHFFLEFGGVLTMTHGNGTLDLPGGANITTAASDVGEFISTAADVVTCVNYTKRDGTAVVGTAHTGNVAFPATQSASADANTLDDYEEGAWTATLSDADSDAGMATTTGIYTKIGRMVYCEIQMRNNNLTGITSTVRISGLPFTSANDGVYPALSCGHMNSAALAAATGYIHGFINPNTSYIELRINDETDGGSGLLGTEWGTGGQFFGSIFYHST